MPETIRERIEAVWSKVGERGWSQYNNLLHALLSDGSLVPADDPEALIDALNKALHGAEVRVVDTVDEFIDAAVAEAVERERERCALIALRIADYHKTSSKMNLPVSPSPIVSEDRAKIAREIAAAIRQPTQERKEP